MPTPTADATSETTPATAPLDLADIQGNVVRGYSARRARHFALAVSSAHDAAEFVRAILPDAPGHGPKLTTAAVWDQKPHYCLNIGFTWKGLHAMGLPDSMLALFPQSFRDGPGAPADKAKLMGEDGASDPSQWVLGGTSSPVVHCVVSVYTHAEAIAPLDTLGAELLALFSRWGVTVLSQHDANALPDGKVHFGYKDGIAQPRIAGVPGKQLADMQPECSPGEFLLGKDYINQYGGNFLGDLPNALGDNACYGAFRLLKQDVAAFEKFIALTGARNKMDPELVAAKMMGRWRNGTPLVMSPTTDQPEPPVSPAHINHFDYAPAEHHPTYYDDQDGLRCPVGAHMRRMNPRSSMVMGKPYSRRIIRRAMAYGPLHDPTNGDDGRERGLVGYFLCGDLSMQFEFMQSTWANQDLSTAGLRGTRDPLLGAQPSDGGRFTIRTSDSRNPITVNDLPRLVTTRGSVYCVLLGMGGLRFLASAAAAAS